MPLAILKGPHIRVLPPALMLVLVLGCKDSVGPRYGAPSSLVIAGGDAQSGAVAKELATALIVRVLDAEGRAVPRAAVAFRVLSGGGSVAAPPTTDSLGLAAGRWTLGTSTADSQRVQVTVTAGDGVPSVTFRANPVAGPAASVAKQSGDAQQGEVVQRLAQMLVAVVKDAYGNPVPRVEVRWTADASSVTPQSDTTDATGLSRASWTLGTAAVEYAARATVGALPAASFVARGTPGPAASIAVDPDYIEFTALGDTVRLGVQGRDRYGNLITSLRGWRSSDGAIATVDTAGVVRSAGNGKASIVVASGTAADTVAVTVQQVPVGMTVSLSADTMNAIGDTVAARGRVLDRNGREIVGAVLRWASSDEGVAQVTTGGSVISRAVGRAVVRGISGAVAGSANIIVRQIMASIRLSSPALSLLEGDTIRVTAFGVDSNEVAMGVSGVTWTSSHPEVATVANGLITGVRFGATDVVARSGGAHVLTTYSVVAPTGRIGGGYYHSCALDGAGKAWCWGLNDNGQIGNGTTGFTLNTTPQAVSGGRTYTTLSVSERFACGLTAAGEVYCWGRNHEGQVGDGTTTDAMVPTLVKGGIVFKAITVGERHACGLDAAGRAYCWGEGLFGALANGSTSNLAAPTEILGALRFRSLVSGDFHVCGIATDGLTYCWGYAYWGATGRGTKAVSAQTSPLPVATGERYVQLASGYMLTCGLTANRTVSCWGQLDPWATNPPPMGVPTPQSGHFVAVSVGFSHVCGYTLDRKLHCWGTNNYGELGNGARFDGVSEGDVTGGKTFVSAGMGQSHTCAIASDGQAYCWGAATFGQLGAGTEPDRAAPGPPVAATASFR